MRQIILDTETTGLYTDQGHRIIEIGCVELINRKLTGQHFHCYLNPDRDIDADAQTVHGLNATFLADKPRFTEIVEAFMAFIQHAELIIHNAPFDVNFINYELSLLRGKWKTIHDYCKVIDTLALARQIHVGQRNSLDALCKRYNIDNTHRELHGALLDANLLAQVYLAMTGGQATFFGDLETTEITVAQKQLSDSMLAKHKYHLRVIKADEAELALHANKLQQLQTKGKCLWAELNATEVAH